MTLSFVIVLFLLAAACEPEADLEPVSPDCKQLMAIVSCSLLLRLSRVDARRRVIFELFIYNRFTERLIIVRTDFDECGI